MNVVIRPADLASDKQLIIDALYCFLNPLSDDPRFSWLYENNPHGRARAWVAYSSDDNKVIGLSAAFPRRIYVNGYEKVFWVLGDFCIKDEFRSLGPALMLQRACLAEVDSGRVAFCCDFPSASMVAVYKRLGFSVTGKMLRLAKPLRVDRKVKEIIENSAAQRVVSAVGNTFLRIGSPRKDANESFEVSINTQPCGEEFTVLAQEQRDKVGICLRRSAEYLNWRYVNNPLARHEIITARRDGRLVGYIVCTQTEDDASIVDLFGEEDSGLIRRLTAEIVALARKRGVVTVSVSVNESHPWLSVFSEMGFRLRESSPVVIIPSKTFTGKIDSQLAGWYLMQGDRDS